MLQVTAKIIVVVVRLVDDSGLVGLCLPSDVEGAADNLIGSCSSNCAGESILAILSHDGQTQRLVIYLICFVHAVHPSRVTTSVQTVVASVVLVVLLQLDCVAIEDEATHVDAVRIAAYARTIVSGLLEVLCNVVKAQYDVDERVVLVGHHQRDNACTIIGDANFHALVTLKGVELHSVAIDDSVELGCI